MSRARDQKGKWGLWYLVSSLSLWAERAATEYSFRFSCEEGFKDSKWWLGFKQASYHPEEEGMSEYQSTFFIQESIWREIMRLLKISGRETEIIRYIMTGEPDKCIASRLGISTHTVRTHVERLYIKLNINSRSQLITRIFAEYVSITASHARDKL